MRIGELANKVGMAPSAIRYYERMGLIDAPERTSGQRRFTTGALQSLRFIQLAQAGGFTLAEVKTIFDGYPKMKLGERWHVLAKEKKKEIGRRIRELEQVDAVLDALLRCECATIDECVDRCSRSKSASKIAANRSTCTDHPSIRPS